MVTEDHPLTKLTDYSLDLLQSDDRKAIARHLQQCPECRRIAQADQALALDIRSTLIGATRPSPTRLRQLAPSSHAVRRQGLATLRRPALAFTIVLLLFVVGLNVYGGTSAIVPPHHTATSVAATATLTPTSTVAPLDEAVSRTEEQIGPDSPVRLSGTPVAALFAIVHN